LPIRMREVVVHSVKPLVRRAVELDLGIV